MGWEEIDRQVEDNIARYGQHIFVVFPTLEDPGHSFLYTVGNFRRNRPELLLIGLDAHQGLSVLNAVAGIITHERGGRVPVDGELFSLGEGAVPLKIIDAVDPCVKAEYTCQATRILGTDAYNVQQVLIPDPLGRYPGDHGCEEPYCDVPVLGWPHRILH